MPDPKRNGAFDKLEGIKRVAAAEFFLARSEYFRLKAEHDRQLYAAIRGPHVDFAALEAAKQYAANTVKPARRRYRELQRELARACVDTERLRQLLPAALTALGTAIDFERLLIVANVDSDLAREMSATLRGYLDSVRT